MEKNNSEAIKELLDSVTLYIKNNDYYSIKEAFHNIRVLNYVDDKILYNYDDQIIHRIFGEANFAYNTYPDDDFLPVIFDDCLNFLAYYKEELDVKMEFHQANYADVFSQQDSPEYRYIEDVFDYENDLVSQELRIAEAKADTKKIKSQYNNYVKKCTETYEKFLLMQNSEKAKYKEDTYVELFNDIFVDVVPSYKYNFSVDYKILETNLRKFIEAYEHNTSKKAPKEAMNIIYEIQKNKAYIEKFGKKSYSTKLNNLQETIQQYKECLIEVEKIVLEL